MAIKRLTRKELIERGKEIFYDYMSSSPTFFNLGKIDKCTKENPTPMHMLYQDHLETIKENEERQKMYREAISEVKDDPECAKVLEEQLKLLEEEHDLLVNMNMESQKETYKKQKTGIDYARSCVRIPLDKLVNSYYDDFVLEVAFYDDIAVSKGKFKEYAKLKSTEERKQFIKDNTEITHMGLAFFVGEEHKATVELLGKINMESAEAKDLGITLLDSRYSDFDTLSLKDTMEISNNDLSQLFQSKIDLDKENMTVLADKMVGYDNYKILKPDDGSETYFIRYICPSTGRVYFNELNLSNLQISEYYKPSDYDSYIYSWWSINNLGADPFGKAMWRC